MAKDLLDKAKDWAQILSLIAIPLVVLYVGSDIQSAAKERELKRDYVQIAAGILGAKDTTPALRSWAVQILEAHSPVRLSREVQTALISDDAAVAEAFRPRSALNDAIAKYLLESESWNAELTKRRDPIIKGPETPIGDKGADPIIRRPNPDTFPIQK